MPNSFITIQEIARETLPRLLDNLVFPNLVYKDFSDTFTCYGDTIQVRRPVVLEASEFNAVSGVTAQDITESTVPVKLDKIATVDVEISAVQGAVNIRSLAEQFLEPAAAALAAKINSDGLELYKDIPYYTGTAGTTPDGLDDIVNARKMLNINGVPTDKRCALWNTDADAALIQIPSIVNAEKSGSNTALRSGSLGRVMGLDNYMCQAKAKCLTANWADDSYTLNSTVIGFPATITAGDTPVLASSTMASTKNVTSMSATGVSIAITKAGTYRFKFSCARTSTSGTFTVQLYKNGSAVSGATATWSSRQGTCSADIACAAGDTIEIWAKSYSTSAYIVVGQLIACINMDNGF